MRRLQVGSGEGCDAPGLGADSRDPSTVGAELRKKIWELLQGRDHKWSGGYAWQQGRGCGCTGKIGVGGWGVDEQGKGGEEMQGSHCAHLSVLPQNQATLETMAAPGGVHDQEAEGADGHCEFYSSCWGPLFFFPLAVLGSPASGPRLLYPL